MAAAAKPNTAKVSMQTEAINMKFVGSISACTIQMFESIMPGTGGKTAAEVREQALKIMQARHEKLIAEGR
jgi:hypothetical protein